MGEAWQHQVRVYFSADAAASWRAQAPGTAALRETLAQQGAALVSQADAFEAFLAEPGAAATKLGRWTAAALADPDKRRRHALAFAVRVGGAELYPAAAADALEAALAPFVASGCVLRLSRHDSNPAATLPIPAEFGV